MMMTNVNKVKITILPDSFSLISNCDLLISMNPMNINKDNKAINTTTKSILCNINL